MTIKYWIGGDGDISDTEHLSLSSGGASGASKLTSADTLIVDGNSNIVILLDELWAWGRNVLGTLGDGTTTERHAPVQIGSSTWKTITAGRFHSLAILGDDTLWAWGNNQSGQLGDGGVTQRNSPVQVGSSTWESIIAGGVFSIGIQSDDTLWAWGQNNHGQLGDGGTTDGHAPVQIGSSTWKLIGAGDDHSLAILS